jgi:hypothetical protein
MMVSHQPTKAALFSVFLLLQSHENVFVTVCSSPSEALCVFRGGNVTGYNCIVFHGFPDLLLSSQLMRIVLKLKNQTSILVCTAESRFLGVDYGRKCSGGTLTRRTLNICPTSGCQRVFYILCNLYTPLLHRQEAILRSAIPAEKRVATGWLIRFPTHLLLASFLLEGLQVSTSIIKVTHGSIIHLFANWSRAVTGAV